MLLYITVNTLCAVIMTILMFMVKRGVMHEADQKTFFNICFHCLLLFSLDILWVFVDGATFSYGILLNKVINAAYFAQSGVLCYFWSRYSLFLSSSQFKVWNVHRVLFALPMIIIGIMSFASIWTGWFFTVDDANHYHRGELNIVQVSLIFAYLLYSFFVAVFTIKKKRELVNKNKLYAISALGFLPFFANIVQIQYPGLSVFCVGATLGLVVVFLEIQREMISLDPLTRLNNRNQASIYLSTRFKQEIPGKKLYQFAMDLDRFKGINDTYGHDVGDLVLKRVAEVLKYSFRSTDLVFRLGGDEFVVIMANVDSSMRDHVKRKIDQANVMLQKPTDDLPPTSLSVGVAFADRENPDGDIFKDADTALYRVKEAGRCGCYIY